MCSKVKTQTSKHNYLSLKANSKFGTIFGNWKPFKNDEK